ncbi:metallophosphoesterase [Desulfocapsa sp. AH-315-G09]|nr:metallophosphoesterase [Desulfocapsa sp.]MBN4048701.1 metallophosphoesterase [bacterium AH-315-N22]MBN4065669.1 metallophosphoesterase [Desulfocapsa sp. AH-315-G09]
MNILHISDLHFGVRHWDGFNGELLDKINSYPVDLVINTGDSTSDGLESEYLDVAQFLEDITCKNVISIIGNHDKRNMRSHEYFEKYIDNSEIIAPLRPEQTDKKNLYLKRDITKTKNYFTDLNYIKLVTVDSTTVLVICIDSNVLYQDEGFVEEEILKNISLKINRMKYDKSMMLIHHPILVGDITPLLNPLLLTAFIKEHNIGDVFCGHTHRLDLRKSTDLCSKSSFTQYNVGSLSSSNRMGDDNMFLYLENWGTSKVQPHLIKIHLDDNVMRFTEELL